jgi:hypothetical protein
VVLEGTQFEQHIGPFVRGAIDAREAAIRADGLASYLPLAELGIAHDRHVQGKDRARSAEILPWSHTIFSNLKAWLMGTSRGVSREHMLRYLAEFVHRFNRRWRETELFGFVLTRAVRREPFPYSRLAAELFR